MDDEVMIQKAELADLDELYEFARGFSELRVSSTNEFMDRDEFEAAVTDPRGTFLVAKSGGRAVGFIYAGTDDPEKRSLEKKWACLVYLAVAAAFRKRGIAGRLYQECVGRLKEKGVTHLYGWANSESGGAIISFMKKRGFAEGHRYTWMDRKL